MNGDEGMNGTQQTTASLAALPFRMRLWGDRPHLRLQIVALAFAALAGIFVPVDTPLSNFLRSDDLPGDIQKGINLCEAFGHGFGATIILISVFALVPVDKRTAVLLAAIITTATGLTANQLKRAFVRVRPHSVEIFRNADAEANSEMPLGVESSEWDPRIRSFPSGHSGTAWGLAIGLTIVFPRGLWVFACLASLASLQRITSGAHWPSDVFGGAAVACCVAGLILAIPRLRQVAVDQHSAAASSGTRSIASKEPL